MDSPPPCPQSVFGVACGVLGYLLGFTTHVATSSGDASQCSPPAEQTYKADRVIILSLDGFRYDYLDKYAKESSFLNQLRKNATVAGKEEEGEEEAEACHLVESLSACWIAYRLVESLSVCWIAYRLVESLPFFFLSLSRSRIVWWRVCPFFLSLVRLPHPSPLPLPLSPDFLLPVFPSKTFPNHYSIMTGLYPSSHGIIANSFSVPGLGAFTKSGSLTRDFWLGEPLWVTMAKSGRRTAQVFWPGLGVEWKGTWDCE